MRPRSSTLDQWRTLNVKLNNSNNPLMEVRWIEPTPDTYDADESTHTIAIDANGGSGTKLRITLTDDDGANNLDGATYTTLQSMIDAINALTHFEARRLHGPADYSMDSDDFIELSSTELSHRWTQVLYRDASEIKHASGRIQIPNASQNQGLVELGSAISLANSGGASDCVFRLSRDPGPAATNEELIFAKYVPDNTETEMFPPANAGNVQSPWVYRGPILVELEATSSLAVDARALLQYRHAEA